MISFFLISLIRGTDGGLFPFKEKGKFGFKTLNGVVVLEPEFDGYVIDRQTSYVIVRIGKKYGILNQNGQLITEIKYDFIWGNTEDKIFPCKLNSKWGFIDVTGKEIVSPQYDFCWGFSGGLALVEQNNLWGFINTSGKVVVPIEYNQFEYNIWSEGLIGARKNHKWGYVDTKNNVVIPFNYNNVETFSEGLAFVQDTMNKWGFIDHSNNVVIPFIYEFPNTTMQDRSGFKNGIAVVRLNGMDGCINKKGEVAIPFKYSFVGRFYNGMASVKLGNGERRNSSELKILFYGYIDSTGKEFLYPYNDFRNYDWNISKAPKKIPDYSRLLKSEDSSEIHPWTLEKLLSNQLSTFTGATVIHPYMSKFKEVSIGAGLNLGASEGKPFTWPDNDAWNVFKEKTFYKIISEEPLRKITWGWICPYYENAFQKLNPLQQKTYKEIADYLKNYINNYDVEKVKEFLIRDPGNFAFKDVNGNYDPSRKLSSFVDRLILVHKVVTVDDAKLWINKIADEVDGW